MGVLGNPSLAWSFLVAWRLFFYASCIAFVSIRIIELGIVYDDYPSTLLCVVAAPLVIHFSVPVGGRVALQAAMFASLILGSTFVFDELALVRPFHARYDAGTRFEGKTVYITGANSGIGYETAWWAATWGRADKVWLACRSMKKCQVALERIEEDMPEDRRGGRVLECTYFDLFPTPLSSAYKRIDEFASTHTGEIDVLINNAGAGSFDPWLVDLHDVNSASTLMMSAMHSYLRDALKPKRTVSVSSATIYILPFETLMLQAVEQISKLFGKAGMSGLKEPEKVDSVGIYDLGTATLDMQYSKLQHTLRITLPSTETELASWFPSSLRSFAEYAGITQMAELRQAVVTARHAKTRLEPRFHADGETISHFVAVQGEAELLQMPKDWEAWRDNFLFHPGFGDSIYARKLFDKWRSAAPRGELHLGKVLRLPGWHLGCQVVSEFNGTIYDNSVFCGINYAAEGDYIRAKLWQVLDLDEETEVVAILGFVQTSIQPWMSWGIVGRLIRPGRLGALQVVHSALTDELAPGPGGGEAKRDRSDPKDTPRRCMNSFNALEKCLTRVSYGGFFPFSLLEKLEIQETYDYFTQKKLVAASIRAWNERYSSQP